MGEYRAPPQDWPDRFQRRPAPGLTSRDRMAAPPEKHHFAEPDASPVTNTGGALGGGGASGSAAEPGACDQSAGGEAPGLAQRPGMTWEG